MNIGSILSAAGIAVISGNSQLNDVINSSHQGQRVIVFFYNEKCQYTQGMVNPYVQIARRSPLIKFYGFNAANSIDNIKTAKKYTQISPTFSGFVCSRGFGGFFGDNRDSLRELVAYLGSTDNTC